jgi:hypothetical protein
MNLPPLILPAVLALGLGSIYVLPQTGSVAQSAIRMELPETVTTWFLEKSQPSQAEIDILGKDTTFSKASCYSARPNEYFADGKPVPDRIDLSIVLSGYDLNTSIHRPERCLPAQGHTILSSGVLPLKLANGRTITVRRLKTTQILINPENRKLDREFSGITYYFFVGHDRLEYDHIQRTLADMQARLIRGMDPRWAYVSASMWFGNLPWIEHPVPEAEADAKLAGFLTRFAERQINWEQVK